MITTLPRPAAAALIGLGVWASALLPASVESKGVSTTITSIDSGARITFAPEDTFRLSSPTAATPSSPRYWDEDVSPAVLDAPPAAHGPAFAVKDVYWPSLAAYHRLPGWDANPTQYAIARFYPQQGVVALDGPMGNAFWFELDLARDRLLQRYLTLLDEGIREPTFLDVLRVAHEVRGESIRVDLRVDGQHLVLEGEQARRFWPAFVSMAPRADLVPGDFGEAGAGSSGFHPWAGGYWPVHRDQDVRIEFSFPGERQIEYTLLRPEGVAVRAILGWPSWPAFEAGDDLLALVDGWLGEASINHRAAPDAETQSQSSAVSEAPRPDPLVARPLVEAPSSPGHTLAQVAGGTTTVILAVFVAVFVAVAWLRRRGRPSSP